MLSYSGLFTWAMLWDWLVTHEFFDAFFEYCMRMKS